jgi:hypothetical protein
MPAGCKRRRLRAGVRKPLGKERAGGRSHLTLTGFRSAGRSRAGYQGGAVEAGSPRMGKDASPLVCGVCDRALGGVWRHRGDAAREVVGGVAKAGMAVSASLA